MNRCKSFKPQINKFSKILILGSMPGEESLKQQQYYAHKQNRFWKLMGIICKNEDLYNSSYEIKIKTLLNNKIALWDVLESCEREGSLDSDIKHEKPNKINKLLDEYSNVEIICLNGTKAYNAFKKHFPELLKKYKCYKMPSTSPANAKYRLENLYREWEKCLGE